MPLTNSELESCAHNCNSCCTSAATDDTRYAVQHTLSAVRELKVVHVDAVQVQGARDRRLGRAALYVAVAGKIPERQKKLNRALELGLEVTCL